MQSNDSEYKVAVDLDTITGMPGTETNGINVRVATRVR